MSNRILGPARRSRGGPDVVADRRRARPPRSPCRTGGRSSSGSPDLKAVAPQTRNAAAYEISGMGPAAAPAVPALIEALDDSGALGALPGDRRAGRDRAGGQGGGTEAQEDDGRGDQRRDRRRGQAGAAADSARRRHERIAPPGGPGPDPRPGPPHAPDPIESRSRPGGVRLSGPSTDARCSIRLSVPPRLVAPGEQLAPAAPPPAPPPRHPSPRPTPSRRSPAIWRAATAWPGIGREARVVHRLHRGMRRQERRHARRVLAVSAHPPGQRSGSRA